MTALSREWVQSQLPSSLILVSCEGGFEHFAFTKLLDHGCFVFGRENIRDITSIRSASKIQETYLGYDYDVQLVIMRLLDSLGENFQLGKLYRDRFPVCSIHTRPEAEILAIIKEGRYEEYNRKAKSRMRPSDYCRQELGLPDIKRPEFLEAYWGVDDLVGSIVEYRRMHRMAEGELCLADLLRASVTRNLGK